MSYSLDVSKMNVEKVASDNDTCCRYRWDQTVYTECDVDGAPSSPRLCPSLKACGKGARLCTTFLTLSTHHGIPES